MSKSRHTDAQMIEPLKQLEACEGRKMWLRSGTESRVPKTFDSN
jgi:hypothetical protein